MPTIVANIKSLLRPHGETSFAQKRPLTPFSSTFARSRPLISRPQCARGATNETRRRDAMAIDSNISGGDRSSRMFEPMVGSDALFLDPSTGRASDSGSSNSAAAAEAASARDPTEWPPQRCRDEPGPNVGDSPVTVPATAARRRRGPTAAERIGTPTDGQWLRRRRWRRRLRGSGGGARGDGGGAGGAGGGGSRRRAQVAAAARGWSVALTRRRRPA